MSLIDNANNVAFATAYNVDKIVNVWESSFDRANDVITRNYSGMDVFLYRIPHGFTRPVFTDLLWSLDGTTYVDGGIGTSGDSGDVSISFSDNTYVYIVSSIGSGAVGTFYYKLIGFWIDNYDNTNPLVPAYRNEQKPTLFDSRDNYQKKYLQDVLSFTSTTPQTVSHNLGYKPNFKVFFEAFTNEVWPMNFGGSNNPFQFEITQTECTASINTSQLSISLSPVSGTKRAWYRIYLDQ